MPMQASHFARWLAVFILRGKEALLMLLAELIFSVKSLLTSLKGRGVQGSRTLQNKIVFIYLCGPKQVIPWNFCLFVFCFFAQVFLTY